ncbi:MAG: helix-turn-helix domain-containing protein [Clostridia bacterium]|nr:helix-turn-helix domain-containing protein [Clostridia bacterium]
MAIINYIEKHTRTFSVEKHKHSHYEIIYVTEGSGEIITDEATYTYCKGETICIPPNLYHKNISTNGMKNIHLTIEDVNLSITHPRIISATQQSLYLYRLLKIAYDFFHLYPANTDFNLSLSNVIAGYTNKLLSTYSFNSIVSTIEKEIIDNYTNPYYNIDEAFFKCNVSKERARKIFTQDKKITPIQFLKLKRIELAKHLLSRKNENNLTINEIATTCGFADPAYFSRVFKKETGTSPLQYELITLKQNKLFTD